MVNPDTDGGGLTDGTEDANHDGRIDTGELNPNDASVNLSSPSHAFFWAHFDVTGKPTKAKQIAGA